MDPDLYTLIESQIRLEDPWGLDSNPFERARFDTMLAQLSRRRFDSALEVGCAAGAFTERLAPWVRRLRVIDLLPEAIEKAQARLGSRFPGVRFSQSDVAMTEGFGEDYDLIVVSEVLYYLDDRAQLEATTRKLASWLRPSGLLLFCSGRDRAVARWGLRLGAETAMEALARHLTRVDCEEVSGETPDEDALIASYVRRNTAQG